MDSYFSLDSFNAVMFGNLLTIIIRFDRIIHH